MATDIYSIKFTAHARKDLDRIFSYIASELYAPQAATRIMKMIGPIYQQSFYTAFYCTSYQ